MISRPISKNCCWRWIKGQGDDAVNGVLIPQAERTGNGSREAGIAARRPFVYCTMAVLNVLMLCLALYLNHDTYLNRIVGFITIAVAIAIAYGLYRIQCRDSIYSKNENNLQEIQRLATAVEHTDEAIAITDVQGVFQYVNPAFQLLTGYSREEAIGQTPATLLKSGEHNKEFYADLWDTVTSGRVWSGHTRNRKKDGSIYDEMQTISPIQDPVSGVISGFVTIKRDITEQLQLEQQLVQAQKLESIGQLAAGIAHEINTPTQYVGDNTRFVKDAFDDIGTLFDKLAELQASESGVVSTRVLGDVLAEADVEYLRDEIPKALAQSLEGVERVAKIVRAMKEFSHPAQEKTLVDLNAAIQSTLTVATSEYKYVADVETDFDPDLPQVNCLPGEFNQVILNMIVNAAHAISDALGEHPDTKGVIRIATRKVNGWAEIEISDTGCGMPEDVKARIFDPFFTTKEVGKGTGQGLNIAHNVVINKHDGQIKVESEPGKGTCFTIRLPLEQPASSGEVVAV